MKSMTKLSLLALLGVGMVAPAMAQDNFPDVPENHWAFEALENLKREGILVGYPDGRYRGTRFMTRYEVAVAINAAYKKMMSMYSGLADQVAELEKMNGKGEGVSAAAFEDLKKQVAGMKSWGDEVASLKKMAGTFEKELAGLGVDVEAMKKDLEEMKKGSGGGMMALPVAISGEANVIIYAGNSRDGQAGMTKDGRIVGVNEAGTAPVGLTKDANVYHDISVNLKGTNTSGPMWNATLVFGNFLSGIGSNNWTGGVGQTFSDNVSGDVQVQDFSVKFDDSLAGLGFSAEIGRIAFMVSPYMFKKTNGAPYSKMSAYDDGKYRIDGANLRAGFGENVGLTIVAGKNSNRNSTMGTDLNPIAFPFGSGRIDGSLIAVLDVKVNEMISGKAAYLFHDTDGAVGVGQPNRLNVMGVDGTIKVGGIAFNGGYSESQLSRNTNNVGAKGKAAFVNGSYAITDTITLGGEFRRVTPTYIAAGSWRRIGTNWTPTNIETITGMLDVKLNDQLALSYMGEFGDFNYNGPTSDIESHNAKLKYTLNDNWKVMLGYEDVKIDIAGADIRQKWASVGLGYNLGTNAMLDFAYEYGSVQNPVAWGRGAAGSYRGGFLSSQLSIKF